MMRPSPSVRIRLDRRPIHSRISRRCPGSPSSSTTSTVSMAARSRPGCWMAAILPPPRCLRRSIQNMGGEAGFSRERAVKWILAWAAPAQSRSLRPPRRARTTWSLAGCWTFSIRRPTAGCNSRIMPDKQKESSGITCHLHHGVEQLVDPPSGPLEIEVAEKALQGGGLEVVGAAGAVGDGVDVGVPAPLEHR